MKQRMKIRLIAKHRRPLRSAAWLLAFGLLLAAPAGASPTEVVHAVFERRGDAWSVAVTLRHDDRGWKHYANLWVVETLAGQELGRRELLHPHEDEQPFTRSAHITIPAGVTRVRVRAGDNVGGLDRDGLVVDLATPRGPRYEVR